MITDWVEALTHISHCTVQSIMHTLAVCDRSHILAGKNYRLSKALLSLGGIIGFNKQPQTDITIVAYKTCGIKCTYASCQYHKHFWKHINAIDCTDNQCGVPILQAPNDWCSEGSARAGHIGSIKSLIMFNRSESSLIITGWLYNNYNNCKQSFGKISAPIEHLASKISLWSGRIMTLM